MHKVISFFLHALGGATVTGVIVATLAWFTYAESRHHTVNALSQIDETEASPRPDSDWDGYSVRAKAKASPAPNEEHCQLPPIALASHLSAALKPRYFHHDSTAS